MKNRVYIACDLKSFYASVECIERDLDPLATNLVVADKSRTDKTICLAVTPSLKAYGISGRARLFEVVQKVAEVNAQRQRKRPFWTKNSACCWKQAGRAGSLVFSPMSGRTAGPTSPNWETSKN